MAKSEEDSSVALDKIPLNPGEAREFRKFLIINGVFSTLRLVFWLGAVALWLHLAIPHLAGEKTSVQLLVDLVGNFRLHVVIPTGVAILFFGLWRRERHVRKTAVEREHRRVEALEKKIDSGRSSSGLAE